MPQQGLLPSPVPAYFFPPILHGTGHRNCLHWGSACGLSLGLPNGWAEPCPEVRELEWKLHTALALYSSTHYGPAPSAFGAVAYFFGTHAEQSRVLREQGIVLQSSGEQGTVTSSVPRLACSLPPEWPYLAVAGTRPWPSQD